MHGQSTDRWERAPGAAAAPSGGYRRREPERTLLHAALRAHLEPFLEAARRTGSCRGLPGHVERELRDYLDCGILARGFHAARDSKVASRLLHIFTRAGFAWQR